MAINLQKGQRVSLDNSMKLALVGLGWDTNRYDGGNDFDLDASAFLLGENGKLLRDEDFVFYNNLNGRDGAVVHTGDNLTGDGDGDDEVIMIDFTKIPSEMLLSMMPKHAARISARFLMPISESQSSLTSSIPSASPF